MNNNDMSNSSQNTVDEYHATYNLNTAMENPQAEFNDAMNVNIVNDDISSNVDNYSGSFQNDSSQQLSSQMQATDSNFGNVSNFDPTAVNNLNLADNSVQYSDSQNTNSIYESTVPSFSETNNNTENSFIPTMANQNEFSSRNYEDNTESDATYAPVMENHDKVKISFSKEVTFMFVIVLILVLFLLLMPYFYDFFRNMSFGINR